MLICHSEHPVVGLQETDPEAHHQHQHGNQVGMVSLSRMVILAGICMVGTVILVGMEGLEWLV